ncbi:MAG: DUF3800 domain-containing protein [Endomicrobiaceae bacterium]|jgi:hypothetical protein|nr:DUF3800 domain-containing protein [Endomicrobiaceae bacterium]
MLLCYIDESGTPELSGNSSHYVLCGLAIPIYKWKKCENDIQAIKQRFNLVDTEIHTAWILRKYNEQLKVKDFDSLPIPKRIYEVDKLRKTELLKLQRTNTKLYKQTKKNYRETQAYIHLTFDERRNFILELAKTISSWDFARLFAECVDKINYNPAIAINTISEQALEQITTRFEYCLMNYSNIRNQQKFGLLIHDNNETVAKKHTELMRRFHTQGTFWKKITHIVETPLFVNSKLTNMVQIADLCAYAIRIYLERNNTTLFDLIVKRADKKDTKSVGIRHFTHRNCHCKICLSHK